MASYYDIWQPNFWLDTFWPEEFWYSDDDEYAGPLTVTLADLTPALTGYTTEPGSITGTIAATLGPLTASYQGTTATVILFDLPVNISVNWQVLSLTVATGAIDADVGLESFQAQGVAWEQSYTDGLIQAQSLFWHPLYWGDFWSLDFWPIGPQLDGVTAAITGTLESPGAYAGFVSAALEDLTGAVRGAIYPETNYRGEIAVTLGNVTAALAGTHVDPIQTGSIAATFDGLSGLIQGLSLEPGPNIIGRLNPTLQGVGCLVYGTSFIVPRTGAVRSDLDGITPNIWGLYFPEGTKVGTIHRTLVGVGAEFRGANTAPRQRERAQVPTVTEIDWKTLCDQHNPPQAEYDYEFSNGRRFKQA